MDTGNRFQRRFRGLRRAPASIACTIGVVLLLLSGGAAHGAGGPNVVAGGGKAAGHGYGYWLQRSWQFIFDSSPPVKPCQTLSAPGQRVGYLTLATRAPGKYKFTCREPAGRPLYLDELSAECSTFKGDHGNFGSSAPQLQRCARATFKGLKNTTTLNGRPVNMKTLIAGTGVYPVHIRQNNTFGAPPGNGQSAAYGYGLLLTGLGKATYDIHSLANGGGATFDITWMVRVQ